MASVQFYNENCFVDWLIDCVITEERSVVEDTGVVDDDVGASKGLIHPLVGLGDVAFHSQVTLARQQLALGASVAQLLGQLLQLQKYKSSAYVNMRLE